MQLLNLLSQMQLPVLEFRGNSFQELNLLDDKYKQKGLVNSLGSFCVHCTFQEHIWLFMQ